MLEQISVFAENRKGRLASIIKMLKDNGIDMRGLTISDTTEFGIARMIVSEPEKALKVFTENNLVANLSKVIAFSINDTPGALYDVISKLTESGINIEYCYSLMGKRQDIADIVIKTDETERAETVLRENGVKLISAKDVV